MAAQHPFTFMVRPSMSLKDHYGWTIFEREREREFSKVSYATQREAEDAAKARMIALIAAWRTAAR